MKNSSSSRGALSTLLTVVVIAGGQFVNPYVSQAGFILPISSTPSGSGISEGNFALATDDDLGTGYVVTNTNSFAQGFNIRFDFDVSEFSEVYAFTLYYTGVYNSDNPAFQQVRIGADPFHTFTVIDTPLGQQFSTTLITTSTGAGFWHPEDTGNYIHGNTLSIYLQTQLGSGKGTFTQITTLEIFADIHAQRVETTSPVPLPSSIALLLTSLPGGCGLLCWRRLKAQYQRPAA